MLEGSSKRSVQNSRKGKKIDMKYIHMEKHDLKQNVGAVRHCLDLKRSTHQMTQ